MKLGKTPGGLLVPANMQSVRDMQTAQLDETPYIYLAFLCADVIDTAAVGHNTYLIVGTTKDRSAASIAVFSDGGKDAVYGPSLIDIAEQAGKWL